MKNFSVVISAATLAAFLVAPVASAATISLGSVTQVGSTLAASSTSANAGTDVNLNTNVNVSGSGSMSSTSMAGMAQTSGPIIITAADAASGGATLNSSSQVQTAADFNAFARGQMQANPNIQEVDANDSAVTVKYAEPGLVLGLFPVTMTSSASISSDGNVSLSHPWYYFLTSTNTDNASLKAALSTEAAAAFNQTASPASEGATSTATGSIVLSATEQAQVLADIDLALSSALAASSTASY